MKEECGMKRGSHKTLAMLAFTAALGFSGAADAGLSSRMGGLAVYDDVLNITWLANANLADTENFGLTVSLNPFPNPGEIGSTGRMNWFTADAWITAMNADGGTGYLGYNDWRLPATAQPDPTCSNQFNPGGGFPLQGFGFSCTGSELPHMFYNNLGATAGSSILSGSNTTNLALFSNIQPAVYWSGTEYAPNNLSAWLFFANSGFQVIDVKDDGVPYAWAVRSGDVAAAPEPASIALVGLGLVGLGWMRV
jgi:hypothetical protein